MLKLKRQCRSCLARARCASLQELLLHFTVRISSWALRRRSVHRFCHTFSNNMILNAWAGSIHLDQVRFWWAMYSKWIVDGFRNQGGAAHRLQWCLHVYLQHTPGGLVPWLDFICLGRTSSCLQQLGAVVGVSCAQHALWFIFDSILC